jgi:hypothetical protein
MVQKPQKLRHLRCEERTMTEARGGLRSADDQLLAATLAGGATQKAAGQRIGMSARTVRRRLADPEFSSMVQRLSGEAVRDAYDRLRASVGGAFDTIVELTGPEHAASIRLAACKTIITEFPRYFDIIETEHRLRLLESFAAEDKEAWA